MPCPSDQSGRRTELVTEVLGKFGSARIRVYGSSMLPSIRPGDEIELQSTSFHDVSTGDVIAYGREDRLFIHRVVRRNSHEELVTRGDTLSREDAPVTQAEFLGSVSSVFRDGERVDERRPFLQRAAAALFRRSQLCAAVFVKFGGLTPGAKPPF